MTELKIGDAVQFNGQTYTIADQRLPHENDTKRHKLYLVQQSDMGFGQWADVAEVSVVAHSIGSAVNQVIHAEADITAHLGVFLKSLSKDPLDPSTNDTPARWMKMMREMTEGYTVDIPALFKQFDQEGYDGMVVVGPIKFYSLCEHHLLPFHGSAWVGYLPNTKTKRIVGLSKLARLVTAHAKRLQVQERMTHAIAHDIVEHLAASGAGVRIESVHTCMCARGAEKEGLMRTQSLLGTFKLRDVRSEFAELVRKET